MGGALAIKRSLRPSAAAGWLPLPVLLSSAAILYDRMPPWVFMWTLAFSIYMGLKWASWWRVRAAVPHTAARSIAYLLAWPGMDADAFLSSDARIQRPATREWLAALSKTAFGAALFWGLARVIPGPPLLRGWVGMIGLILVLHFGSFHVVALMWQRLGVDARPIMSAPLRSTSLSEFWGRRWNLGFRQLSYDFIFRPLQRTQGAWAATMLVFLASGVVHDLVISVPARGGYGLPTLYFLAQGAGVALERSRAGRRLGLASGKRGWLLMIAFVAGPVFWLFHPLFVLRVVIPFMKAVRAL